MVTRSLNGNAGVEDTAQTIRERSSCGISNRKVIQASAAWRWRRSSLAFPRVQSDVMVITARRKESGLIAISLHQIEAEHIAIKFNCAIKIRDFQMNMANARAGSD